MLHVHAYLLLGFASRLVDWVLVLFGLPGVLLLVLLRRLETGQQITTFLSYASMFMFNKNATSIT